MVDDFIEPQARPQEGRVPHPLLAEMLADTYGVIVYQEQVMQIAQIMGGLLARRRDLLASRDGQEEARGDGRSRSRPSSTERRARTSIRRSADQVFELDGVLRRLRLQPVALAAYGWITYQTAYSRRTSTHEFMAGSDGRADADTSTTSFKFIGRGARDGLVRRAARRQRVTQDFSISAPTGAAEGKVNSGSGWARSRRRRRTR